MSLLDTIEQKIKDQEIKFLKAKFGTVDPDDEPDIEAAAMAVTNIAIRRLGKAVEKYLPQIAAKIPGVSSILTEAGIITPPSAV